MLYLAIPLMWLIYEGFRKIRKRKLNDLFIFLTLPAAYFLLRVYIVALSFTAIDTNVSNFATKIVATNIQGTPFILRLLTRIVNTPIKGVAQSFIPYQIVNSWLVVYIVFVLILTLVLVIAKNNKKTTSRYALFNFLLIIIASVPYIFLPGTRGDALIFDSRNLYSLTIGSSMLISLFLFYLASFFKQRLNIVLIILVVTLSSYFYRQTKTNMNKVIDLSQRRRQAVSDILEIYPQIDKKTVFFVGGQTVDGGISGFFNSGFAWDLEILYRDSLPPEIFKNRDLYYLPDYQGYNNVGEYGFGVFYDIDELSQFLEGTEELEMGDVRSLYFNQGTARFENGENYLKTLLSYRSEEEIVKSWLSLELSERWVWFDLAKGNSTQVNQLRGENLLGDFETTLLTAKAFTHPGWVGAYLEMHFRNQNGKTITLPKRVYGYQMVHLSKLEVDRKPAKSSVTLTEEELVIKLENELKMGELLTIGVMVNVNQLQVDGQKKRIDLISSFETTSRLKTQILETTANGAEKEYTLNSEGKVSATPIFGGKPVVYLNNMLTTVKKLYLESDRSIKVEFETPPNEGFVITIPVMIEKEVF